MAFTSTYSFSTIVPKTAAPNFFGDAGVGPDTAGLSGGGWVTASTDAGGFTDLTFYSATGSVITTDTNFSSTNASVAQMTNGNVITVGESGGNLSFQINGSGGGFVSNGSIASSTIESNTDVAALTGGGFVVVDQADFSSGQTHNGTDHDIEVYVRDSSGNAVTSFAIDTSGLDDEDPSVAGLADGGFAVAFDRTDSSGNSVLWYAVYNADGSTRLAATQLDGVGSINTTPSITALKSGGFTIGYEDNGWDTTQPDITLATLDANGNCLGYTRASSLSTDDSQASVTTLSNGYLLSTFTNNFNNGGDLDIRATLTDPTTLGALTDITNPPTLDFSGDVTSGSSVSALSLAQFAVSYTNSTTGATDVAAFQLVRTATGTAGNDTFTGDDAVNIVAGQAGNDNLTGGNNNDTLNGGTGNDRLLGLNGNDTLIGGAGDDFMNGGQGFDTASYSSFTTNINVNLSLSGAQNTGGAGTDTLTAIENLTGGSGNDNLTGSSNKNRIVGGAGNDSITGLVGADVLTGGAGSDTFVYKSVSDSGLTGATIDTITDFVSGTDKIDLSAIDANTTVGGNQAFTFIGTSHFSGVAGQLDLLHSGANTFVVGDTNGDSTADFKIKLTGNLTLVSTDFNL